MKEYPLAKRFAIFTRVIVVIALLLFLAVAYFGVHSIYFKKTENPKKTEVAIVYKVETAEDDMYVYADNDRLAFTKSPSYIKILVIGPHDNEVLIKLPHQKIIYYKLIFDRNSPMWKMFLSNVEKNGDLIGFSLLDPEKKVYLY